MENHEKSTEYQIRYILPHPEYIHEDLEMETEPTIVTYILNLPSYYWLKPVHNGAFWMVQFMGNSVSCG